MVEYNKVNVKLLDSQVNKLRSAVKNQTGVTLTISIKMFKGNSLPHALLLTTRQKTKPRNATENNMSTDIKLSKTQMSSLLSKIVGPLMKVTIALAKYILAPLGITAAVSGIQKKKNGSGTTTLIISNEEINDIMKIVQALEDSHILLKGITKTVESETKEQKRGFLVMSLGTLGASLLGNILTGKGILGAGYGNKEGKGILKVGYGSKSF